MFNLPRGLINLRLFQSFKDLLLEFVRQFLYLRFFIGRGNDSQEDAELPVLVALKAVEEGFVGGGGPGGRIVAVGVSAYIQDGLGEASDALFCSGDTHDYFPERQRQIDIREICRIQKHRRNLFGLIAGNAAADGGDEEFEFLVLPGEGGEALDGRGKILQAFHRRYGV